MIVNVNVNGNGNEYSIFLKEIQKNYILKT